MTQFLPLVVDTPACNMPAPGDSPGEPIVVQLLTAHGEDMFLPLSLAAAQALVQLLLRENQDDAVVLRVTVPDRVEAPPVL